MSPKKLLFYLAVLVVVAGGYFFSEYRHSRQAAQEKAAQQIFQITAAEINTLTLKSDKGEIHLQRVAAGEKPPAPQAPASPVGDWQITRPVTVKADELTINSLLSALTDLKMQRHLDEVAGEKLKDFGLEKPIFSVEFQAGGQTQQLRFGHKVPGTQNIYAQKNTEPRVLSVRISDKETLDRSLTALRAKQIFTVSPEQVTEMRLSRNEERLTLQKTGPSEWSPAEQLKTKLRTDKITTLLGQLTGAKAQEFVAEKADDLKKFGLAPSPALRLTLLTGKQEETLLVGSKQGEQYYAQISGTAPVILVDKSLIEKLPVSYDSLEDRRLWAGQEAEVHKVIWGAPDTLTTAVRDKNGWSIQAPDKPAQQQTAMKFSLAFWRLKEMEFTRLLPVETIKDTKPLFSLQLLAGEEKPLFRLEEFPGEKDQARVTFAQGEKSLAALIPAKALSELKEILEHLMALDNQNQEKAKEAK